MTDARLSSLQTPRLIVDEAKVQANIARLRDRIGPSGVAFRPHLKTVKSVDLAKPLLALSNGAATVSTLKEAEVFAAAGATDILYAVGIAPQKLDRVHGLRASGCDLTVILDSLEQAEAVACASTPQSPIPVLIEIDCDGHRGGVRPSDPALIAIAEQLGANLRGVMTHAGESYARIGVEDHAVCAESERQAAVMTATRLREAGFACPVVSIGSTPTVFAARDWAGVTEVRAGVFVFFDLVMARIGVCHVDEIALSVLTTVIGHRQDRGWILIDTGWTALSQDRGGSVSHAEPSYGLICDEDGQLIDGLVVSALHQEHGIVFLQPGSTLSLPDLPIGSKLRILPNHACATASQFDAYDVLPAEGGALKHWPRFGGWQ